MYIESYYSFWWDDIVFFFSSLLSFIHSHFGYELAPIKHTELFVYTLKVLLVLRFFFFGEELVLRLIDYKVHIVHCTLKSTYLEFKVNKEYLLDESNIARVCKDQSE